MYYKDHQDFENLKRQYNTDRVIEEYKRANIHKAEVIENLEKFMTACIEQKRLINSATIKKYVYFSRRTEYRTNRIYYEVVLMKYPDIERGQAYQWTVEGTGKIFTGREKKAAKEYADTLAKEHGCEIIG